MDGETIAAREALRVAKGGGVHGDRVLDVRDRAARELGEAHAAERHVDQ
jgi:hypothetical protein